MFYYSLTDQLPKRAQRYIQRASERYFEIRKEFQNHNWKVWESAKALEENIHQSIEHCRLYLHKELNGTTGLAECTTGGSGYSTRTTFVVFSESQIKLHAERYRGDKLLDYGTIDLTFQIIDDYLIKNEMISEGILDDKV